MAESRLVWLEREKFVGFDGPGIPSLFPARIPRTPSGLKPTDLLMLALASCSAVDTGAHPGQAASGDDRLGDRRKRGEQEPEAPWPFKSLHVTYRVRGRALDKDGVRRAVELAEGKYCSVAASLRPQVTITHAIELAEDQA